MIASDHRTEALLMLEKKGAILETAREVSRLLAEAGIDAAVIGGVAVVLHGHVRTTIDVDVLVADPPTQLGRAAQALEAGGYVHDPVNRQFVKTGIPVHLLTSEQTGRSVDALMEIEQIRTVDLGDLISMKLRSGTGNVLRSQDLADVIGLIRSRRLSSRFAARIDKPLRGEFRRLVRAVREAGAGR